MSTLYTTMTPSHCDRIANEILMYFRSSKKTALEVSLSEPIETDKEGNTLALMDIISCDDNSLERIDLNDNFRLMYGFIESSLDDREKEIIIHRYGLYGHQPMPQREIAKKFDISRSYVSRLESKALSKLREEFEKGNK